MIKVSELNFTYPGGTTRTLHELNFEISEHEIFGFLGPSGAGKSTTQNILIGLLKDYQGSATVLDREISDWNDEIYEQIGVCFELPNHYHKLSAKENLDYFRSLYQPPTYQPEEVLEWVGLTSDANKRVSDFSKGMKTRLNLARSLIHKPKILFLDEPTGGLDPVNSRRVKELIRDLRARGTTIFVTTHDMMVADHLCDRVAFIADGKISNIENPDTLKKQHGSRSLRLEYLDDSEQRCEREFSLDGIGQNDEFIELLKSAPRIETIHSQETTLDQVFINLTGQELTS